jgi:two-component system LytT family response regulator
MNVFIIDDEKPNRIGLTLLINQHCPGFTVVGEAESAESARKILATIPAEILLLDINMPNENGFELLSSLDVSKYQVVFITAYAEYAIRAFRANAVDYLLKPVDVQELQTALNRCKERKINPIEDPAGVVSVYKNSLRNTTTDIARQAFPSRLTLPHKQGFKIITVSEIVSIEASGNYTVIYLENKEDLVVTRVLHEFESLLDPSVFFRVHKSTIINLEHVLEYSSSDGHMAAMKNGQKVIISRRRLDDFMTAVDQRSKRI